MQNAEKKPGNYVTNCMQLALYEPLDNDYAISASALIEDSIRRMSTALNELSLGCGMLQSINKRELRTVTSLLDRRVLASIISALVWCYAVGVVA